MPQGLQDPEFVELGFPTLITTVCQAFVCSFSFVLTISNKSDVLKRVLFSLSIYIIILANGYFGVGSADGRSEDFGYDVPMFALL